MSTETLPASSGSIGPKTSTIEPWNGIVLPSNYSINRTGVFQADDSSRLAGPVWISACTHDPITGDHGLVIQWLDLHGKQCELAVTRDELHSYAGSLVPRLARGGLLLTPGEERKLLRYLSQFDPNTLPRWRAATRIGWIEDADRALVYMLPPPVGLIAVASHAPVIFQPERESPTTTTMYARGTLDDWNHHVANLCRSNPLLLFSVLVGLSGPLLRFAELESGGFHFYGRSSHGKTTAAQVAASVWGNGADPAEAPDRAYVQKWNSTSNAFEATMSAHNDGLLVLDEIHTCDAKDFAAVIYNMSGGKGRQALDRDRQLRHARKWRAMYFSTGEISVFRRLQADAKEVHAGQLLRLIDIPIEGGIIVASRDGHAAHAEKLKASCGRFFGVAGPALIRELVANYEDVGALTGTVKSLLERYGAKLTPPTVPPEQRRAIKRFALLLVAGELATKLGILDCTLDEIDRAVRTGLRAWLVDGANLPDRLRGILNVQAFLERFESRFQNITGEVKTIPHERAGFVGWDTAAGTMVYLFTPEGFAEACAGQDPRETSKELLEKGFLHARERGHMTEKRNVGGARRRVYVVLASLLEFDPQKSTLDQQETTGATGANGARVSPADSETSNAPRTCPT